MIQLLTLIVAMQTPTFPEDEMCNLAVSEDFVNTGELCSEAASVWALKPKTNNNQVMEALTHFESGIGFYEQHNRNDAIIQLSTACSILARLHVEKEYPFVFIAAKRYYPEVFK